MTHSSLSLYALITCLACSVEPLEPEDVSIEPRESAACGPDHTLAAADCELDLSGAEPKPFVPTVTDGEAFNGYAWAKVACIASCECEYTSPGKVGNQTASCEDLGWLTPEGNDGVCGRVVKQINGAQAQFIGEGATAAEANAAAIEGCKKEITTVCQNACAADKAASELPKRWISCCKPRKPGNMEGDESGDSGSSDSGDAPDDSDTTPVPTPDAE